jgi:nitronate monooxygenase
LRFPPEPTLKDWVQPGSRVRVNHILCADMVESVAMQIRTPLTEMFDLTYPIVLAPMAWVSGGELASAVSNSGGLGLVGGGYGDPGWLDRELAILSKGAQRSWGVGLITWSATDEVVDLTLSYQPDVFFLSFGDAAPFIPRIKDAGCRLILQVQGVPQALEAKALGADLIVAQGAEAGGHGSTRATLPLVPAVVDAVDPTPLLAAGGVADGRGLAAALALGAAGAVIGTRFCATEESLMHPVAKQAIVSAAGDQTVRTRAFDQVRGLAWPEGFTARALRNLFLERWAEREEASSDPLAERDRYFAAVEAGDFDTAAILAGEALDLIDRVEPAGGIVERIGRQAQEWLQNAPSLIV